MAPPPHLFPILNGGHEHITAIYDLPSSASIHQTESQVVISMPTSALKKRRVDDEVPKSERLPRKELLSFWERVSVMETPGNLTFITLSGNADVLKIEPNQGTPGAYLVFHGASPPRFLKRRRHVL